MGLRRGYDGIQGKSGALDGLDDAMSWLETRTLAGAWMPF